MTEATKKFKGVVELDICGEKAGFKFGMATTKDSCELEGLKCDAEGLKELSERLASQNPSTYLNLFYAAARSYARLFKTKEPSFDEVCNWVDNMEAEQSEQTVKEAFAQPPDPNQAAPQKGGQ